MNIHPDRHTPMHDRPFYIQKNIESLRELMDHCRKVRHRIDDREPARRSQQRRAAGRTTRSASGSRASPRHRPRESRWCPITLPGDILAFTETGSVASHLHDNKGGHADLHLPLGCGNIDVAWAVRALQAAHDSTGLSLSRCLRPTATTLDTAVMYCAGDLALPGRCVEPRPSTELQLRSEVVPCKNAPSAAAE